MGKTQHLGLNKFGAEGRLSDEAYKFSLKDRELIDSLLQTLLLHDHQATGVSGSLDGPPLGVAPTLTVLNTGGALLAGRDYYYKIAYLDSNGNETEAGAAGLASTPDPLLAPESQVLTTATTGGTLEPGTYKYAIAFYQTAGGVTTAPNVSTIIVPTGTNTNTITIPLQTLPDDADGWRIFRKGPGDLEYWLLTSVASGPTEYVDDGTINPDCTQKRPIANSTNSTNSITIDLPAQYLPLDQRVVSWRIYRTNTAGLYPANSLVATVVETTTEGGADLVTTFTDLGDALSLGVPLGQTAVPVEIPQLDANAVFAATSKRIPSTLAPLGVRAFNLLLPGTLAVKDYHQFVPPHDMLVERLDGFYLTAPTGLTPSTDFLTVRVSDDAVQDEIQSLYNDAVTQNEIQQLYNNASAGTFTLGDGVDTTSSIAFDALPSVIKTRLETDITAITTVTVTGTGTVNDPWVIEWIDPGATNFIQLTVIDTGMGGGASVITTTVEGSDGGTFTLSDGTDTTSGIAYNAAGSVIKTRLETDITSITTVTVTGTGTQADPWLIEFDNPGSQDLENLIVDDGLLNGLSVITEDTKGFGVTQVDLIIDQNQAGHVFQTPTTDFGTQEAEDAPATGGTQVSDSLALNDSAMELDAQAEKNTWNIGTLDAGDYVFRFWVADTDQGSVFDIRVVDLPSTTLASLTVTTERPVYTPSYELFVTLDGTEDIQLEVEKTDADTNRVRVDKYEYEVVLPVLHSGSNCKIEVLVTGTPTTNGDDLQLVMWY